MGIYAGGGWFVHASTQGTTLQTLSGWYAERFAWGRRPLREAGLGLAPRSGDGQVSRRIPRTGDVWTDPHSDTSGRQASDINGRDQMLHWKSKLAYLLVAATVLAAFLGEAEGWHW